MNFKTLAITPHITPIRNLNAHVLTPATSFNRFVLSSPCSSLVASVFTVSPFRTNRQYRTACTGPIEQNYGVKEQYVEEIVSIEQEREEFDANDSIWRQMKEIAMFAAPASGLWICGPLMSVIDTAVIGQGSSLELAALGPGTVVCDYLSYVFMFISIATSNMVATSLAKKIWENAEFICAKIIIYALSQILWLDKNEVQHQISILLFVGFSCGVGMLLFTKFLGAQLLTAFAGPKNFHIVPVANTYVQIRGLAWPALLVGWVAQSASLGMKDSWGPLKALVVSSAVNVIGHIVLCCFFGYGIAGAAWATMASQVTAAVMMIRSLKMKGFNAFSVSVPSPVELLQIFELAAPVFITLISKVAFFSLLTYFATSMGTITVAAHQVYCLCTVWGEPLSQTAQSFMPELLYGVGPSLAKARMLLNSLLLIGGITGLTIATVGTFVPWLFPYLFTTDRMVIGEMHKLLLAFFVALVVTPSTNSVEGTLLAGRDLRFLSLSMTGCFSLGGLLLLLVSNRGYGLLGCWWAIAGFQWARYLLALRRLTSPRGLLYSEKFNLRPGTDPCASGN